jgi:hypothetical protein
VAGLTPAMIALLTLGACCSTTAAATAGIGVVANATGTSTLNLLVNSWFLSIFQLAVLWIALVAQERLIGVYSALLDPTQVETTTARGIVLNRRTAVVALARVLLLGAAVTWSLSMLADWTVTSPLNASAAQWADWIFLVQVPAVTAAGLALAPGAVGRLRFRGLGPAVGIAARAFLVMCGALLLIGLPAAAASAGFHGWGNELLGSLGVPASSGGVVLSGFGGVALALRWALQMWPLAIATLALAVAPRAVTDGMQFHREGSPDPSEPRPQAPPALSAPAPWPGASAPPTPASERG